MGRLEARLAKHRPATPFGLSGRVPAGVCVPIRECGDDIETWIIVRPPSLRDHAGELCFPGGKPEPGDADLRATALREAAEELGIPPAALRVVGSLSPIPVATSSFAIHPIVAAVSSEQQARPQTAEVAQLIRAPLGAVVAGHIAYEAVDMGSYVSPIFRFANGLMYGASAHVLLELLTLYTEVTATALPAPLMVDVPPWLDRDSSGP